jgi:hypothetical protein
MAITAFLGALGSGKTLGLTWLALRYYTHKWDIYANFHLFKINYTYIEPEIEKKESKKKSGDELIELIDGISKGFMALDEVWLMLDSRLSFSKQNRFIGKILLKSRKRKIDIGYTAQDFMQVEKRLRKITDYLVYPEFDIRKQICSLEYTNRYTNEVMKTYKFYAPLVYPFYQTTEEVKEYGYS